MPAEGESSDSQVARCIGGGGRLSWCSAACGSSGGGTGTRRPARTAGRTRDRDHRHAGTGRHRLLGRAAALAAQLHLPARSPAPTTRMRTSTSSRRSCTGRCTGTATAARPASTTRCRSANAPVYSDHDRVVTIRLKPARWSDGEAVSARDVIFWINLLKANKADWASYVPGGFPDNVIVVEGGRAAHGAAAAEPRLQPDLVHRQRALADHAAADGVGHRPATARRLRAARHRRRPDTTPAGRARSTRF